MALLKQAHSLQSEIVAYKRFREVLDSIPHFTILDFDEAAAMQSERLKYLLTRVGTRDLKIASVALTQGATVLTSNLRDFTQVPGLNVEDWTT
jgi:tRNA(fMet)-specific endonuclease VapC